MKYLLKAVALIAVIALVLTGFSLGLSRLEKEQHREDKQLLEQALQKAAVACYAAEGFYPPDVAYLQQHYGIQFDETRYIVRYTVIASNLMPDITVLDK